MADEPFWRRFGRERTRSWQEFLNRTVPPSGGPPLFAGPLDGRGSDELTRATRAFQAQSGVSETGRVDEATTRKALREPQWTRAWISPRTDGPDLLHLRPYFVVPLDETAFPGEVDFVAEQIRKRLAESAAAALDEDGPSGRITDLYVMSHGWHRNFFAGVAAYDRIVSRMSTLISRGAIVPPEPFNPLFVGLHWHSDPGENGWLDQAGRRDKASFMRLVRDVFTWEGTKRSEAEFILDFEAIFEFMAKVSAPDVSALDPDIAHRSRYLARQLVEYRIRGRRFLAPHDDKVSTVWRCYVEAEVMRPLSAQTQKPRPVGTLLDSLATLGQFVVGVLGLGAVAGWVLGLVKGAPSQGPGAWERFAAFLQAQPWASPLTHHPVVDGDAAWGLARAIAAAVVAATVVLGAAVFLRWRSERGDTPAGGMPLVQLLAYVVLQLATAVPLLGVVLLTFLFRNWLALLAPVALVAGYAPLGFYLLAGCGVWSVVAAVANLRLVGVFSERGNDASVGPAWVRDQLAALARWPVNWLRAALGSTHRAVGLAKAIENQLAFFEMQRKGAATGIAAGAFLASLVEAMDLQLVRDAETFADEAGCIRIHLVGHSFGGLVICNAARTLARAQTFARCPRFELRSLCLVQGALASGWFEGEKQTVDAVKGALSCVFSRYDSANGFWYPAANQARLAAGFLGLSKVANASGLPVALGRGGQFAMLARPPKLAGAVAVATGQREPPYLLNLDGSRLIYDGPLALGGGHGDIFKDDVVNLIWAATRL